MTAFKACIEGRWRLISTASLHLKIRGLFIMTLGTQDFHAWKIFILNFRLVNDDRAFLIVRTNVFLDDGFLFHFFRAQFTTIGTDKNVLSRFWVGSELQKTSTVTTELHCWITNFRSYSPYFYFFSSSLNFGRLDDEMCLHHSPQ